MSTLASAELLNEYQHDTLEGFTWEKELDHIPDHAKAVQADLAKLFRPNSPWRDEPSLWTPEAFSLQRPRRDRPEDQETELKFMYYHPHPETTITKYPFVLFRHDDKLLDLDSIFNSYFPVEGRNYQPYITPLRHQGVYGEWLTHQATFRPDHYDQHPDIFRQLGPFVNLVDAPETSTTPDYLVNVTARSALFYKERYEMIREDSNRLLVTVNLKDLASHMDMEDQTYESKYTEEYEKALSDFNNAKERMEKYDPNKVVDRLASRGFQKYRLSTYSPSFE